MAPVVPEHARVTPAQAKCALHMLAAAAHRRWAAWQQLLHHWLKDQDGKEELRQILASDALPEAFQKYLSPHNDTMVKLVLRAVDKPQLPVHELPIDMDALTSYHEDAFRHWANYALDGGPDDIERWQLQCRTPFLHLSSQSQESDYHQAVKDLQAVAKATMLVLPNPLPKIMPRSTTRLRLLRLAHCIGLHGEHLVSEAPWSHTCQGCHKKIAVAR